MKTNTIMGLIYLDTALICVIGVFSSAIYLKGIERVLLLLLNFIAFIVTLNISRYYLSNQLDSREVRHKLGDFE